MDAGLLVARMVFGLLMAAHGSQKLFGWFGGYGIAGTGGFFESLGFRPGRLFALAAGLAETGGGLLLALGLFEPVAAAIIVSVMVVAAVTVHWQGGLFAMTDRTRRLLARRRAGTHPTLDARRHADAARARLCWRPR